MEGSNSNQYYFNGYILVISSYSPILDLRSRLVNHDTLSRVPSSQDPEA